MAWAVIALGVFGLKSVSGQCMYEITAIVEATPCGPGDSSGIFPEAMNDHGVVTGSFGSCSLGDRRPFIWSVEMGFVEIPLPPGVTDATPVDINNHNEIVGTMNDFSNGPQAFYWKDGVWTELEPLPGLPKARANAINDYGVIVGESVNTLMGPQLACTWQNGKVLEIELPGKVDAVAHDVNVNTSVVGQTSLGLADSLRAFWWNDKAFIEIPPLPRGNSSNARALNSDEAVTGTSGVPIKNSPEQRRSWLFKDGTQIDLGLLGDNPRLTALSINDANQIVGYSSNSNEGNQIPFLWQQGHIRDLCELIDQLPDVIFPQGARAINDSSQIAIQATSTTGTKMVVLSLKDRPLGDVNIDCVVDERDLIAVLDDWGPDKLGHLTDMVTNSTFQPPGDGVVDGADLAVILGNWSVSGSQSSPKRSE